MPEQLAQAKKHCQTILRPCNMLQRHTRAVQQVCWLMQLTLCASVSADWVSAAALPAAVPPARWAVMPRMPVLIVSELPLIGVRAHATALSIIADHGVHSFVKVLHKHESIEESFQNQQHNCRILGSCWVPERAFAMHSQLVCATLQEPECKQLFGFI